MKISFLKGVLIVLVLVGLAVISESVAAKGVPQRFNRSSIISERIARAEGAVPRYSLPTKKYPLATPSEIVLVAGKNVNVIGKNDVMQKKKIDGITVYTCNPGKQTPQNETAVAVNPNDANNLVAGVNDYRLYVPSENRYDSGGGVFLSTDGGKQWSVSNLPGLVTAYTDSPGAYEAAADPAIAAGPDNVFWYANIAFNRSDDANAIAVSRSADGGETWATNFVIQTSATDGKTLFNDKEWIAADPNDPNVAYVTWSQFNYDADGTYISSLIVYSKTTDGGLSWIEPQPVTQQLQNQGSVVFVDTSGNVHVVWETFVESDSVDAVAYAVKTSGSETFADTQILATINDVPDPFSWAKFRTNSFPAFVTDGNNLHVVWSDWNGSDADIVYIRSTDGGVSWSSAETIDGGESDQFFPWVGANNGKVFVSYMDHRGEKKSHYHISIVASSDGGASWSDPVKISTKYSAPSKGNKFDYPNCTAGFIGDYTGIAVGEDGVAHPFWTDIRKGNSPGGKGSHYDQDPYTVRVTIP